MALSDFIPVIGDVANALSVSRQNRLNREFAEAQADKAWNRSLEQWERETQYNSFSNQMRLLKEAGLNPNLAYDQSTDSASGQTPQMAEYAGVAPQINPLSPFMAQQAQANIDLANAQAENLRADSMLKNADLPKHWNETTMSAYDLQNMINDYTARQQSYMTALDEDGQKRVYDYWAAKARADLSKVRSDIAQARWSEKESETLFTFVKMYGLPPDAATAASQIERFRKLNELSDQEKAMLQTQIQQLEFAAHQMTALDATLGKIPDGIEPFVRILMHILGNIGFSIGKGGAKVTVN